MDWHSAISRQREALTRIVATLFAMAGLADGSQLRIGAGSRNILPRHIHRAVLRLLRPAESAARRLALILARGLAIDPSFRRPNRHEPMSAMTSGALGAARLFPGVPSGRAPLRRLSLPLFDPPRRYDPWAKSPPVAAAVPRISVPGHGRPFAIPIRRAAGRDDLIDAARLVLRLRALSAALENLPAQAMRFARRQARIDSLAARNEGRMPKRSPLRRGRPPGWRRAPAHAVHDVLEEVHWLARKALENDDTS